jgi:hypothetical protein
MILKTRQYRCTHIRVFLYFLLPGKEQNHHVAGAKGAEGKNSISSDSGGGRETGYCVREKSKARFTFINK